MMDGVRLTPLARIPTVGGDVMHALKRSDEGFAGFGEAYFSQVDEGAVKGWKRHHRMTLNLVVPVGRVRFVVHAGSERRNIASRAFVLSPQDYARLTVPPDLWMAFQGLGPGPSLVLNVADIPHDPTEAERCELTDIPYDWSIAR